MLAQWQMLVLGVEHLETRAVICAGLEMLRSKHEHLPLRKHGNPPL